MLKKTIEVQLDDVEIRMTEGASDCSRKLKVSYPYFGLRAFVKRVGAPLKTSAPSSSKSEWLIQVHFQME